MIFGVAVLWGGYTLTWWGWLAMTNRVPKGTPGKIWWPSIQDLISPGKAGNLSHTLLQEQALQQASVDDWGAISNGNLNDAPPGAVKGSVGNAAYVQPPASAPFDWTGGVSA
jgi:hypothetical protein